MQEKFPKKRRSIRLKGYDYSQGGLYYITICAHDKQCLFGEILNYHMKLNTIGEIVEKHWNAIPLHFENVKLDSFVIMPNHFHGIIQLTNSSSIYFSNKNHFYCREKTIGAIVRGFKASVTRWCRHYLNMSKIWQRGYHDHIIRDENDYQRIFEYISNNPLKWDLDRFHPNHFS